MCCYDKVRSSTAVEQRKGIMVSLFKVYQRCCCFPACPPQPALLTGMQGQVLHVAAAGHQGSLRRRSQKHLCRPLIAIESCNNQGCAIIRILGCRRSAGSAEEASSCRIASASLAAAASCRGVVRLARSTGSSCPVAAEEFIHPASVSCCPPLRFSCHRANDQPAAVPAAMPAATAAIARARGRGGSTRDMLSAKALMLGAVVQEEEIGTC